MNDIVDSFDLASVHKSGAIVSVDRLAWLNKQHLRAGLALKESGDAVNSVLHANAERLLMDAYGPNLSRADAAAAISLVRSRLNVVSDVVSESRFLFEEPVLQQRLPSPEADIVQQFVAALQTVTASMTSTHELHPPKHSMDIRPDSAAAATVAAIDAVRAATKLKPPHLFPPIRVALTVLLFCFPLSAFCSA
jgi:glutamyl/glutaminyl-tRNA synthetase